MQFTDEKQLDILLGHGSFPTPRVLYALRNDVSWRRDELRNNENTGIQDTS